MTAKVLIADKLSPTAVSVFKDRGLDAVVKVGMTPEELIEDAKNYDGIAVRSASKITADVIANAPNLKVVGRAGIGVDNIDVKAATARGIIVMNTPFGNAITTAEHAISMLMALARKIPAADRSTQEGLWEKSKFVGTEIFSKTLGIIGCGNIGAIVASRALGLKMKVIAFDPFLTEERAVDLGVTKVDLDQLLKSADFITLHTPLNDKTRNILSREALAACKKGVRIINCARGGLVDEQALADAVKSGHVAGAAFDVFVEEPAKESPLFGVENVICTPHLGASTGEAQENVAVQVAEQMSDYLTTGAIANAINFPSVSAEDAPKLKPFIVLAEQLGSFAGQLTEKMIKKVRLTYLGDVIKLNTDPMTAAALSGVLKPVLSDVNMVSAPELAKNHGIEIEVVKRDQAKRLEREIQVTVITDEFERSVSGTLGLAGEPRFISVRDIAMDFAVTEHMLFVRNCDAPGLIGALGSLFGDSGLNIATLNLGRQAPGGDAICVVALDAPVSDALLEKVTALPQVLRARRLKF